MTAPAEMPGVEEIARLLCKLDGLNPDLPRSWVDKELLWTEWLEPARQVKALFDPILAEKERPGTYFANLLQREWIGPDGIRYEPTRKRSSDDVEF